VIRSAGFGGVIDRVNPYRRTDFHLRGKTFSMSITIRTGFGIETGYWKVAAVIPFSPCASPPFSLL
jgi:hypothetical protein